MISSYPVFVCSNLLYLESLWTFALCHLACNLKIQNSSKLDRLLSNKTI